MPPQVPASSGGISKDLHTYARTFATQYSVDFIIVRQISTVSLIGSPDETRKAYAARNIVRLANGTANLEALATTFSSIQQAFGDAQYDGSTTISVLAGVIR